MSHLELRMRSFLLSLGMPDDFRELMRSSGCVISGSCAFQFMDTRTMDLWAARNAPPIGDLDVYIRLGDMDKFVQYFCKHSDLECRLVRYFHNSELGTARYVSQPPHSGDGDESINVPTVTSTSTVARNMQNDLGYSKKSGILLCSSCS